MKVKLNNNKNEYVETSDRYMFRAMKRIVKRGYKNIAYYDTPAFLDTETSHNHDNNNPLAWVYQWCFELNGQYIVGRKPSELMRLFRSLIRDYELTDTQRLAIYIHNASYDMAYLINYMYELTDDVEILAINNHKIITFRAGGLEIRCSLKLSNMSLALYGKKMKVETHKMVSAIDYDAIHYQDSRLSRTDWEYMVNDVASLKECVLKDFEINNDNVATVPLTSTGFVRRDCRKACRLVKEYREKVFNASRLSVEDYKMCKEEFAGGYSHGNRTLAGITLHNREGKTLKHRDFKSRYPATQELGYFPQKFMPYYEWVDDNDLMTLSELTELCGEYCVLARVCFKNLKLKREVTAPYIASSKILNYSGYELLNERGAKGTDNGKVIRAPGLVVLTVNEHDLKWIIKQYDIEAVKILRVIISERYEMSEPISTTIQSYFTVKETLEDGIFRDKSKNKLNGIYGMFATDPIRTQYTYNRDTMEWSSVKITDEYIEEKLDKYYKSRNSFLPYQQGLWTTSGSRDELFTLIADVIGYENYIYSDTDSIFYYSDDEIEARIDEYNARIIAKNIERGVGVLNRKGTMSYYGTFEDEEEDDPLTAFRFLHSKCYATEQASGRFSVTVAGVTKDNKQLGNKRVTKEDELENIDNLDVDFTFRECGGTKCLYADLEPCVMNINGHETELSSSAIITQTTKQLGGLVECFIEWEYDEEGE